MSFSFNFRLEEDELDEEVFTTAAKRSEPAQVAEAEAGPSSSRACHHVSLNDLLDSLPETISYTPFTHPSLKTPLLRRDLFDARFQLISQDAQTKATNENGKGKAKEDDEEEYVDAKSDLIPGLYEGGLKTWEGGVDLVEVLSEGMAQRNDLLRNKRILEVGCGTAFPSSYILDTLFSSSTPSTDRSSPTTIHLQDYNLLVLQLVTLPNLILATLPYLSPESLRAPGDSGDIESVLPDLTIPGHLTLSAEVKDAFKKLLEDQGVVLEFTYGHWGGFAEDLKGRGGYDLVLTAETIYAEESVDDLIAVLHSASTTQIDIGESGSVSKQVGLEDTFGAMSVRYDWIRDIGQGERVVLVAAKVLYFGVGGGLAAFLDKVMRLTGWWFTNVKEWSKGVGRKVIQLGWDPTVCESESGSEAELVH